MADLDHKVQRQPASEVSPALQRLGAFLVAEKEVGRLPDTFAKGHINTISRAELPSGESFYIVSGERNQGCSHCQVERTDWAWMLYAEQDGEFISGLLKETWGP